MLGFYDDPLGFVRYIFPWMENGTQLENETGPDKWQTEFLTKLGSLIRAGFPDEEAIRMAVASGHGVGKTACVAWLILWFMSTRPNPQIVVTANTSTQLTTKTWRELAKWKQMSINGHWFEWTATQIKLKESPATWFGTAVPWSESNPAAFAGTHEEHVLMIFDEASEIADIIWETTEGAMTTPGAIWLCFGNPTRNTGRFRECWESFSKMWKTYQVDSRDAKKADNRQLEQWIEAYGIDSDFVRVRILGRFPKAGSSQLISNQIVKDAQEREIDDASIHPLIPLTMGIDVGSYGNAETVITLVKGPKMSPNIYNLREADVTKISSWCAKHINNTRPDIIFIDANGYGHAVYLLLVKYGFNIVPTYGGIRKNVMEQKAYYNPRMEMWWRMREWLGNADIPVHNQLFKDLIGPEYVHDINHIMRLERKEDMMKRGLGSPDYGDSLALNFTQLVPLKQEQSSAIDVSGVEPEVE